MPVPRIPDSAPFTPEQRTWLNGFLAAWAGIAEPAGQPLPADLSGLMDFPAANGAGVKGAPAKSAPRAADKAPGAEAAAAGTATAPKPGGTEGPSEGAPVLDGDYPWHNPNLDLPDRLALAQSLPVVNRLMAAMAQLDCGACGYMCDTYAQAIASGTEKSLALCSPGGKETLRALKKISKEAKASGVLTAPVKKASGEDETQAVSPGSRRNPVRLGVLEVRNLNKPGSAKHTAHVVLDLGKSGLHYRVGDSLGVYPSNDPALVAEVLRALCAHGTEPVTAPDGVLAKIREALTERSNLKDVHDELVELLIKSATNPSERAQLEVLLESDELHDMDVLDLLRVAPSAKPNARDFVSTLGDLRPRLYSIASAESAYPTELHLTVGRVTWTANDRVRKGVCSTMLSDRLRPGDSVRAYVHHAPGFGVPANKEAPLIMVGPGTGIAPFRAFLQERQSTGATGKNWLFFGDQHAATDFLYEEEFRAMQSEGFLQRISLAFSRDQEKKVYVQDRMREEGAELFAWLQAGACFYVCGDASRMAPDVDRALLDVVALHGGMSQGEAANYIADLRKTQRYQRDVY